MNKKISLETLKNVLLPKEMQNIMGGSGDSGGYRCCCGMGSDSDCFDVNASSCITAVDAISFICPYGMGGCFC